MNLSDVMTIPSQVMAREVGGEIVILDLVSGTYFGLDPIGTRIWQQMANGKTLGEICEQMLSEFSVSREEFERDLEALVDDLLTRDLIKIAKT